MDARYSKESLDAARVIFKQYVDPIGLCIDDIAIQIEKAVNAALASRPTQSDRECAEKIRNSYWSDGDLHEVSGLEKLEGIITAHVASALRVKEKECGELREMVKRCQANIAHEAALAGRFDEPQILKDIDALLSRVGGGA